MLRNAKQAVQSNARNVQWYFVALVTAAIAISYFDRQALPVAISGIQRTIPLNDRQFSWLQFAFLIPYAVLYVAGGRMLDIVGPVEALF
jgi:ACS family hexuronate transporter-like MFS transporter